MKTYGQSPLETPSLFTREPVGHPGCDVCGALVEQRENARGRDDMSRVSDCNVEIRRHPHQERPGGPVPPGAAHRTAP
ncbi:hypothetical protein [Streptomyces iconiensis]|uniref:Uncharacterized protein n=1 Tax=Streptomyces iconiensis TaxID=1384038 RepID=A0ABT6ZWG1_9ACTN|nr:hypothetical protein [Streptomyces iconiensis]MDJ1133405.1 hypothetical protein [Streptomyces iconiensis]